MSTRLRRRLQGGVRALRQARWGRGLVLLVAVCCAPPTQSRAGVPPAPALQADAAASVRITSPLGRTGLPGTIRIVASVTAPAMPTEVRFYAGEALLRSDTDGPPYDALWVDENPFEPLELRVEATFSSGTLLRDTLSLKPVSVAEAVEVSSVLVEASVLDEKGHFVSDLSAGDFQLTENAAVETIDLVKHEREPALFTLLVDSSQSMATQADAIRKTASRLLSPLGANDRVVVAPFAAGVTSVTGPTADRQTVLDAISAIRPTGGTAILDSIRQVAENLRTEQARRAIVLITDGYDENSDASPDEVIEALRENNIALYALGVGGISGISLKGEALLSRLAEETGGRAWFPRDVSRLADAYAAIASDVAQKYLLSYTPSNQRRDGTWRAIDVQVKRPGAHVRARAGYTAPIPPPIRTSLEFTAIGAGDAPVSLSSEQVVVREDGVPQMVDTFQEAVLPVTIMLALDSSGSMKKSATQAQDAAREFVAALRPEDEIGMIIFANTSNYIHSPTKRRDWSMNAIDAYVAEGGTALYDALYDSLAQVGTVKGVRRVVIVVTDGIDENAESNGPGSLRTWEDVLAILKRTEATMYPVGIGARVERARLQELADRSGGAAYFPADTATLAANYNKILDELRRRYVVGYESTNRARDGEWRTVEITVNGPGVEIRSRGGYFAPSE